MAWSRGVDADVEGTVDCERALSPPACVFFFPPGLLIDHACVLYHIEVLTCSGSVGTSQGTIGKSG